MDMSFGMRLAKADRAGRLRFKRAIIAGAMAGGAIAAIPAGLLELIFASTGLSEVMPVLAPPVGWPVQGVLVLSGAAIAAVLGGSSEEGKNTMGWTQSLGLQQLVRLARGQASAPAESVARPARRSRSAEGKARDLLARRRADLHPDAPPRVPLVASLDLPPVAELAPELTLVETPAVAPAPEPRPATPIRDTTDQDRPRPLPRAPEPLSDADLNWVRGLLNGDAEAEPVAQPASASVPLAKVATLVAPREDAPLMELLGRFERGVAERIVLRDAADAQSRVEDSVIAETPAPVEAEPEASIPSLDDELDEALSAALETLRKLSAKANSGR